MREHLKAFYLEYVNAFITVQAMSDYKHMTESDTQACIDMGRRIHEEDVARAKRQCGYVAFFNGKRHELYANSLYEAKQAALKHFKTPRGKEYMVSVMLALREDGSEVVHSTGSL